MEAKIENENQLQKPPKWGFAVIAVVFILICSVMFCGKCGGSNETTNSNNASSSAPAPTAAQEKTPPRSCTTPCSMAFGYAETIKTGGRPVVIKFNFKDKPQTFAGNDDAYLDLSSFKPGDTKFTSPDGTPVRVQIFSAN